MRWNDINLQFKSADVAYFCYFFAHSFHGRQNLLWGGDKEVNKGSQQKSRSNYGKSALGGQNILS